MASNQIQTLNEMVKTVYSIKTDETTEQKWIIPNWVEVQQHGNLVRSQAFEFEMGNSGFTSKWKAGLDIVHSSGTPMVRPYLKLQELSEPFDQLDTTFDAIIHGNPLHVNHKEVEKILCVGDVLWRQTDMWVFRHPSINNLTNLYPDGAITILISLHVGLIISPIKECSNKSFKLVSDNMANLLLDKSLADFKIVTSDQVEHLVHKIILQTQNPVFASMFRSEFSENTTATMKIDDITGKTMQIILHYIYSGKILPEWEDDDTIVEFIYAAEKYQLKLVLEMLDKHLGQRTSTDVSYTDVQLLNLAHKMSLKNAESSLFKNVVEAISNVKNAEELFLIINYHEVADASIGSEELHEIFQVVNGILSDEDLSEFSACDFRVLAFAKRVSMDHVERSLIQKLKKTAKNIKGSAELFKLFEIWNKEEASTDNILVGANPDK